MPKLESWASLPRRVGSLWSPFRFRIEQTIHLPLELNCKLTHLALAWIAIKPHTSTVILGASKPEQLLDNLKALEVLPKLTPEVLEKVEKILDNKPGAVVCFLHVIFKT